MKIFFVCGLISHFNSLQATHNRAGEITLIQKGDLIYEITITTYTYTLSAATFQRDSLEVQWGDNTRSFAPKATRINLPNDYTKSTYITLHSFPGPGTYTIVVEDPNRNFGVKNIPNSVNVIFSIKTTIAINPQIGYNNTPILLNPPFDKAALHQIFIHNPSAFDPDGDSLSYKLTVCNQQNGQPIPNYKLPPATDTLYVDAITGDLVWDTPADSGIYNIAMNIEEWRHGIKIGNIQRDMQVEVYRTTNNPPVNDSLPALCVEAGTLINLDITTTDIDGDSMIHFLSGGPLILPTGAANYNTVTSVPGTITSRFTWQTNCDHVRVQPYTINVKSEDRGHELILIDIDNLNINVLGPSPKNLITTPGASQIRLQWDRSVCNNIKFYNVYRKTGTSSYVIDSCTYGLPELAGYTFIGKTSSFTDTVFIDNNKGLGLSQGISYCYRIVAVANNNTDSYPSDEVCTDLVPGSPSLLNSSVLVTDTNGQVFLSWAKPEFLDTIPANGPYEYIIYRSSNLWGLSRQEIHRFTTSDLNDTTYTDINLNTDIYPYSYNIELYNNEAGNRFLIGKPEVASTLYPDIFASRNRLRLDFIKNVPWLNYEYVINRYNSVSGIYDSIGYSNSESYTDSNLVNGIEYCYLVNSKGSRTVNGKLYQTENLSHIVCSTPVDTVAPCAPLLSVSSLCDTGHNLLNWFALPGECSEDIVKFRIYYSPTNSADPDILDSTLSINETAYIHIPEVNTLAGCYYVTAVDSYNNESNPSTLVCVDQCFGYKIPNVFTPDGDGINDVLHPFPYDFVDRIDLTIFNRWGQTVYETNNPDINWDGKLKNTNQLVSPGVYYYICDVYELRLSGLEVRNITGFVHVYSSDKTTNDSSK